MKKQVVLLLVLLFPLIVFSQKHLKGKVVDISSKAIKGAIVYQFNSKTEVITDIAGSFEINLNDSNSEDIIISCPGYQNDTIDVKETTYVCITLKILFTLTGATVKGESQQTAYIGLQTIKTEVITSTELLKTACCDLAGCFETQGTVQPMTTNILTNSKELRILGISGVYNQVLLDGMPMIQGLTYTYGVSSIPGTLVDNLFVSKGTTSVLQGYESMVGQINIITKSPDKGDKLLFNCYINSFGENQYNFNYRYVKRKWSNLISAHMVQPAQEWDKNRDSFLDLPKLTRYMAFDKIKYGDENKKGWSSIIGLRYLWEQRIGGQLGFNSQTDLGSTHIYGQKVNFQQAEAYTKTGYRISSDKKFSIMFAGFRQNQNSWFGTVLYKANQTNVYGNIQYELIWKNNHELKTGISYRYLNLNEDISFSDTTLKRTYNGGYYKAEYIPGLFAENIFKWRGDILTLITGIRADHHNSFGWKITPRAMLKYDITDKSVIRGSIGTGWRTVNLFPENIGLMSSSRNVVFKESLMPEAAINWGINFVQKYKIKNVEGFMTFDFYQTKFQNQVFPDYDSDPTKAYISNFTGTSISNGFQIDINAKFYKLVELKLAYNFLDVYRVYNNEKILLPFNSKHKILMALSYVPKNKKWRVDFNTHWFGIQRLPDTEKNPEEYRQPKTSQPYAVFNLQVTKYWKKVELYGGCENIFDFRQLMPIVSWQNPFSPYFDTSFNWGPTRGREFYFGIKYKPLKD